MEKTDVEKLFNTCKDAGVNEYGFRFNGGSERITHNNESMKIALADSTIFAIQTNTNYGKLDKPFIVSSIPYDNIDFVYTRGLSVKEAKDILTSLGIYNDEMNSFISSRGSRSTLIPGTAGMTAIKDDNGDIVLGNQSPGYVTK